MCQNTSFCINLKLLTYNLTKVLGCGDKVPDPMYFEEDLYVKLELSFRSMSTSVKYYSLDINATLVGM